MQNLYWRSRYCENEKKHMRVREAKYYDEGRFPYYAIPKEIGHYSKDSERKFCDDSHQMRYLSMPDCVTGLHMDLNDGYSEYIGARHSDDKFKLLRWISHHEKDIKKHFTDPVTSNINIDFICYRGALTTISSTIYETSEDWLLYATKFRSIIYIYKIKDKVEIEASMTEKERLMTSWGHKFEQYITSDKMKTKSNTSVPVNQSEHFFVVLKGMLERHRLLFAAEVDAIDPQYCTDPGYDIENDPESIFRYLELKTSKILNGNNTRRSFRRYKLLKWYIQSFLAGVPRVICGFRDDYGIVRELSAFDVCDLPEMAEGLWSPRACLNFCSEFLNFVKRCVVKDDPKVVYQFYWKPGSEIICEELGPEHRLLPEWYPKSVTVI